MGDLPTPHPGCGQEVSTSSEKTQVLCLIKKVAVAHACLQKATVAVTFLKEVKFFLISGLLEEVGLRSCCRVEQPAELRCTEGGKIKEGSIPPWKHWLFPQEKRQVPRDCGGVGEGVSGDWALLGWDRDVWLRLLPLSSVFIPQAAFWMQSPS